jgi:hypothetical protein
MLDFQEAKHIFMAIRASSIVVVIMSVSNLIKQSIVEFVQQEPK